MTDTLSWVTWIDAWKRETDDGARPLSAQAQAFRRKAATRQTGIHPSLNLFQARHVSPSGKRVTVKEI